MNNSNKFNCVLAAAVILTLVSTACGVKMKSPITHIETGTEQTVDLQVPMPETTTDTELNLVFWAGELTVSPGADAVLAQGTATYNVAALEPKYESNGTSYTLKTGELEVEGIPTFDRDLKNNWDLQLANTPMSLNIQAGTYTGDFELGGLSLEKLSISEGGSVFTGTFSTPNNVVMSSFTFDSGGSTMLLKGLANANFEQMRFKSGAGDYTLSFDGELQRDASVTIDTGAATVNIIVPDGVNAQVTFDGGLSSVISEGDWSQSGSVYILSGRGPTITIAVKMGVGTLNLKTE
jgi:hypothetical protein